MSPGERAEILVNFTGLTGQNIYLKNYGSELPKGIYGADSVGYGSDTIHEYNANFLNGADFDLLKLNIVAATASPVTTIPTKLVPYLPFNKLSATNKRTIVMDTIRLLPIEPPNRAEGPFGMNNKTFDMDVINETVYLNSTEIWTLVNKTLVAHPFHIHDIQFNIIEKNGLPTPRLERGWKDVVLVMPGDSLKFITQFSDFADNIVPYMFHCHLLHHEDDGMMGSFRVIDTTASGISFNQENKFNLFPNPVSNSLIIQFESEIQFAGINVLNVLGENVLSKSVFYSNIITLDISELPNGVYFLKINSTNNGNHKIYSSQKFIKQ